MFLIRANDGATHVCTASAPQAVEAFQSLRLANMNPSMVGFGGRPIDVEELIRQLRAQRRAEQQAA